MAANPCPSTPPEWEAVAATCPVPSTCCGRGSAYCRWTHLAYRRHCPMMEGPVVAGLDAVLYASACRTHISCPTTTDPGHCSCRTSPGAAAAGVASHCCKLSRRTLQEEAEGYRKIVSIQSPGHPNYNFETKVCMPVVMRHLAPSKQSLHLILL